MPNLTHFMTIKFCRIKQLFDGINRSGCKCLQDKVIYYLNLFNLVILFKKFQLYILTTLSCVIFFC